MLVFSVTALLAEYKGIFLLVAAANSLLKNILILKLASFYRKHDHAQQRWKFSINTQANSGAVPLEQRVAVADLPFYQMLLLDNFESFPACFLCLTHNSVSLYRIKA